MRTSEGDRSNNAPQRWKNENGSPEQVNEKNNFLRHEKNSKKQKG